MNRRIQAPRTHVHPLIAYSLLLIACFGCAYAHLDHADQPACHSETYIPTQALSRLIRVKLELFQQEPSHLFARIDVGLDPVDAASLEALGYTYWSTVAVPLLHINDIPAYATSLPQSGPVAASDDPCAVTAIDREVAGRSLQVYARVAQVPAGIYLEVMGKRLPSLFGESPEYVRAVVKFISISNDAYKQPGVTVSVCCITLLTPRTTDTKFESHLKATSKFLSVVPDAD